MKLINSVLLLLLATTANASIIQFNSSESSLSPSNSFAPRIEGPQVSGFFDDVTGEFGVIGSDGSQLVDYHFPYMFFKGCLGSTCYYDSGFKNSVKPTVFLRTSTLENESPWMSFTVYDPHRSEGEQRITFQAISERELPREADPIRVTNWQVLYWGNWGGPRPGQQPASLQPVPEPDNSGLLLLLVLPLLRGVIRQVREHTV